MPGSWPGRWCPTSGAGARPLQGRRPGSCQTAGARPARHATATCPTAAVQAGRAGLPAAVSRPIAARRNPTQPATYCRWVSQAVPGCALPARPGASFRRWAAVSWLQSPFPQQVECFNDRFAIARERGHVRIPVEQQPRQVLVGHAAQRIGPAHQFIMVDCPA